MKKLIKYKHIFWDWNGTLLDDVEIVIGAMNKLLARRSMPLLEVEKYKNIFTFPVRDYYAALGFDFNAEPFEKLAYEFVSEFNSPKNLFMLHRGTETVLKNLRDMKIGQSILSASREEELIKIIEQLNIGGYFTKIAGLNDHYAISKVTRGRELISEIGLKPCDVLLVGDTEHDYEVSRELGCDCLLVSSGHQSLQRISKCGAGIVEDITKVCDFLMQ